MSVLGKDVTIIGGGMIGCWVAYFLAKRKFAVALLDKGAIGAQSSGVNFGNLRLQSRYEPQLPLALRAHELWEKSEALLGDRCEFRITGHLRFALTEDELETVRTHARDALAYGLKIEVLDAAALRRRWPWLSHAALGAGFSPRDAVANPRIASPAVARAASALGAQVFEKVKATGIVVQGDRFRTRGHFIESHVEEQNVDSGLAQETPLRRLGKAVNERFDLVHADTTRGGDAGDLKLGSFGADMRVEAAGGGKDHICGNGGIRGEVVAADEGADVILDIGLQCATSRAKVAAARGNNSAIGASAVGAGRGARPEVVGALELLSHKGRTDDFAVALYQAAFGFILEGHLGDNSNQDRVKDSCYNGPDNGLANRLNEEFSHSFVFG